MLDQSNANFAKILSCAPNESIVTDYDRAHFLTYARVLDAADESTDWRENARRILGCDRAADDETVLRCWDSHLARARWIIREGLALVVGTESETGEISP